MNLSNEEIKLINEHRASKANKKHLEKAKRRVLQAAFRYGLWLARHGRGSSYSTFKEEFGYEGRDCSEMFRVVEHILAAADSIQLVEPAPYEELKLS